MTKTLNVKSPSSEDVLLNQRLAIVSFDSGPLSLQAPVMNPLCAYATEVDSAGENYISNANDTLREAKYYSLLTKFMPSGITFTERSPISQDTRTLATLYPHAVHHSLVNIPVGCQPEIFTGVEFGSCKPPFNGELKSMGDGVTLYSEVATYCLGGMVESYFPTDKRARASLIFRFYESPPVAFAITGAAYIAHIMLVEWIGQLRILPWSEPFFLASPKHRECISSLDDLQQTVVFQSRYSAFEDFDFNRYSWTNVTKGRRVTSWAVTKDMFLKIENVSRDSNDEGYFKHLYQVYDRYSALCNNNELIRELVPAKLLFGQFTVAVKMPRVGLRDLRLEELLAEHVVAKLARALAFLASHGLFYIDLRAPNVRWGEYKSDGNSKSEVDIEDSIYLVDYDDMVIVEPCKTFDQFTAQMNKLPNCSYSHITDYTDAIRNAYIELFGNNE